MAHLFEDVPDALRDPDALVAPFFSPPAPMPVMPAWQPPQVSRAAEDLTCFEPYADGPMSPHANGDVDCPPGTFADSVAAQCRPHDGADPVAALRKHVMYEADVDARRRFDECVEREREIALSSCETGMFPDGREHPGATLEDCVAMWVDGIPDRTSGSATTKGLAHTGGISGEFGPEALRINIGYQQTRSREETRSQEVTHQGVGGTRAECLRDYHEQYARKRKMSTP